MKYQIFSLQPQIFDSFFATSLIARGLAQGIISHKVINWREKYGIGTYNQVDDRPYGGGSGMVLMADPIFQALSAYEAVSVLFDQVNVESEYQRVTPNNAEFYSKWVLQPSQHKNVTISLTPRGFPINQKIIEWLTNFETINILCGRYEGFDARISDCVDLELSLGNFVTNGGEVPAMALIEAVSRLLPGFVAKSPSVMHDSFSSELNNYQEMQEFVVGKRRISQIQSTGDKKGILGTKTNTSHNNGNLFDNSWWTNQILPQLEHPQFTRPVVWQNRSIPQVLLSGDHKKIQDWRKNAPL